MQLENPVFISGMLFMLFMETLFFIACGIAFTLWKNYRIVRINKEASE